MEIKLVSNYEENEKHVYIDPQDGIPMDANEDTIRKALYLQHIEIKSRFPNLQRLETIAEIKLHITNHTYSNQ